MSSLGVSPVDRSQVGRKNVTIALTDWEVWSTDTLALTATRRGSVSYTTVEMFADRVYLHFGRVSQRSWPRLPDRSLEPEAWSAARSKATPLSAGTTVQNRIIEVKTEDVSTIGWTITSDKYMETTTTTAAMDFADLAWPYDAAVWAKYKCLQDRACTAMTKGRLHPVISLPNELLGLHDDFTACSLMEWGEGPLLSVLVYC